MGTDKKGYGKGKKTKNTKSPVDVYDPTLDKPKQLSLPLDLATVEKFRKKNLKKVNIT
jgi:hypothetical protein